MSLDDAMTSARQLPGSLEVATRYTGKYRSHVLWHTALVGHFEGDATNAGSRPADKCGISELWILIHLLSSIMDLSRWSLARDACSPSRQICHIVSLVLFLVLLGKVEVPCLRRFRN